MMGASGRAPRTSACDNFPVGLGTYHITVFAVDSILWRITVTAVQERAPEWRGAEERACKLSQHCARRRIRAEGNPASLTPPYGATLAGPPLTGTAHLFESFPVTLGFSAARRRSVWGGASDGCGWCRAQTAR
jgi:hypothetical protein